MSAHAAGSGPCSLQPFLEKKTRHERLSFTLTAEVTKLRIKVSKVSHGFDYGILVMLAMITSILSQQERILAVACTLTNSGKMNDN